MFDLLYPGNDTFLLGLLVDLIKLHPADLFIHAEIAYAEIIWLLEAGNEISFFILPHAFELFVKHPSQLVDMGVFQSVEVFVDSKAR